MDKTILKLANEYKDKMLGQLEKGQIDKVNSYSMWAGIYAALYTVAYLAEPELEDMLMIERKVDEFIDDCYEEGVLRE